MPLLAFARWICKKKNYLLDKSKASHIPLGQAKSGLYATIRTPAARITLVTDVMCET